MGFLLSELKSWLSYGDIKLHPATPPTYMLKAEKDISDKEKAFRDNNWARIQSPVDTELPDAIFQPDTLGRMVADQALKLRLPNKSVYRLSYDLTVSANRARKTQGYTWLFAQSGEDTDDHRDVHRIAGNITCHHIRPWSAPIQTVTDLSLSKQTSLGIVAVSCYMPGSFS